MWNPHTKLLCEIHILTAGPCKTGTEYMYWISVVKQYIYFEFSVRQHSPSLGWSIDQRAWTCACARVIESGCPPKSPSSPLVWSVLISDWFCHLAVGTWIMQWFSGGSVLNFDWVVVLHTNLHTNFLHTILHTFSLLDRLLDHPRHSKMWFFATCLTTQWFAWPLAWPVVVRWSGNPNRSPG